jgi:tetratricopeptide (TPR) repeat protein
MIKNAFLVIAKLGHECFKLEMLELSECLLEFSLNCIDSQSLRLKMATLSTLSACYWRQSKFTESINCMNLELEMASHLNQETNSDESNTPSNIYFGNIYRLYGNLASAYQRLNKLNDCLQNFKLQLAVSMHIKENLLTINSFNSIGIVYSKLKDHVKSLEYFEKAMQLIDAYETTTSQSDKILLQKLKLKQNNLIGELTVSVVFILAKNNINFLFKKSR